MELDKKLNVAKIENVDLVSGGAGEEFYTVYELEHGFYISKNDAIFGGNGENTKAIPGVPPVVDQNGNVIAQEIPARPESSEVFVKCVNQKVAIQMAARLQDMGYVVNDMAAIFKAEGWYCFSFTAYAGADDEPGTAKKIWREAIQMAKANDEGSYNYEGLAAHEEERKIKLEADKAAKAAERAEEVERRKEIRRGQSEIKKLTKKAEKLEEKISEMTGTVEGIRTEIEALEATIPTESEPVETEQPGEITEEDSKMADDGWPESESGQSEDDELDGWDFPEED